MATKKKPSAAGSETGLPATLDKAFKDNTSLSVAYVAGKNYFFDERLAKSQFDSYQKVDNPYADPEPVQEEGGDENE